MSQGPAFYSLHRVQMMLGMSRSTVARLVEAGYVTPGRGPRNEYQFSFQDLVLLRTAFQLQAAHVPPRRLLRSLRQLRARLPAEVPLSGLRIKAIGDQVAVQAGGVPWAPESGQLLMDFEISSAGGKVLIVDSTPVPEGTPVPSPFSAAAAEPATAEGWFQRAQAVEADDAASAITAYRQALALAPGWVAAYVNLGALLCESGHCREALALYELALQRAPEDADVHFNGAMALEDLGRYEEALQKYEKALQLAPGLADAHYNAARLCERLGDRQAALRHYSAFRRQESHDRQESDDRQEPPQDA